MTSIIRILTTALIVVTPCAAQWAVIDAANLKQSVVNYAAMVEQLARQAEQISNQLRQIRQMEDRLARMGRMGDVKVIVGFPEFHVDVRLPTKIKRWEDIIRIDGFGVFDDTREGIYQPITPDFPDFDGVSVPRAADVYKPAHGVTASVDVFKEVQADVYERRENLRKAIAETSEALHVAETEAEEMKLEAILNAQYAQLAAIDSEVALSAAAVQVRAAEADAMDEAQSAADAEARRKLAQQEAGKLPATFTPNYECFLQYVTEKRFDR